MCVCVAKPVAVELCCHTTALIFYFFSLILPKTQQMCCLHEVYNEKGSFLDYLLTIQNGCPTVKAFHRMNLNQNKCLNSNTASNMTAKVAKPIKMAANRVGWV